MNMAVNALMQDLHRANGHPHSLHLKNTPEWYQDQLHDITTELVEHGWTKTIISLESTD